MDAFLKSLGTDVQDFIDLRRDLHQHPELSFAEHRTSDIVAKRLARMGYTVELGIGGTGVVGQLRRGNGSRHIGIRADMDALPIEEKRLFMGQPVQGRDACLRPRRPHGDAPGGGTGACQRYRLERNPDL